MMRKKRLTTMETEPPKTVRHRRAATIIEIDGEPEEIDTRIVELVQVMNATPGLRTTGSYPGGLGASVHTRLRFGQPPGD
jgi:tRNA(Phe) wybutosine-synthesizing methylase Tyw3